MTEHATDPANVMDVFRETQSAISKDQEQEALRRDMLEAKAAADKAEESQR